MQKMNLDGDPKQEPVQSVVPEGTLPYRRFRDKDVVKIDVSSSSGGNQKKWRTLDGEFYLKGCFSYNGISWRDNFVEVVSSQYAALCKLPAGVSVVRQGLGILGGVPISYSESFDVEDTGYFCSIYRLYEDVLESLRSRKCGHKEYLKIIIDLYNRITGVDCTPYIISMFTLDVIVGNEDRHLNNFGFFVGEDGIARPSPLFDFGLGLFEGSDISEGLPLAKAISKVFFMPMQIKLDNLLKILREDYGGIVSEILPESVNLSAFRFPSHRAKRYFAVVQERLGVRVVED